MTGRNSGGVGPRRLTGIVAAATILAASLLGIAWANSDKAQDKKAAQQAAATQPAQGTQPAPKATDKKVQPVTRTIGTATVAVDPATGRLVPPTPEEAAKLTAALYGYLQREADSVMVIQREDGSLMANLEDTFQEATMATRDKKGNLRLHCVNERAQAEKILTQGGEGDSGPVYNEAKKAEKKAASKNGSTVLETK